MGCLVGPMGRGFLSSESSFQNERVIAECLLRYKTDDGYRLGQWVNRSEEQLKTQWTLIVGNAWRRCRVGHGMSCRTSGKRASLI